MIFVIGKSGANALLHLAPCGYTLGKEAGA